MISSTYQYDPIKSKDYFCLATLFEIILKTNGIHIDQNEIGFSLGVRLPNTNDIFDKKQLGISIDVNKFNNYFKSISSDLIAEYVPINTIFEGELDTIIQQHLKNNLHLIVAYNYDSLYHHTPSEIGHVSLVKNINKEMITFLDPGPKTFGEFSFKVDDLFVAMKHRNGGILVLHENIK